MKPGDLITIRRWNVSHRVPITYVDVYDRFDGVAVPFKKKWEHGELGVLLGGRDEMQEIVEVLHCGRVGWVDEEYLRDINEAG